MSSSRQNFSDLLKKTSSNEEVIDSSIELLNKQSSDPKSQLTSSILKKGASLLDGINEEVEGKQYSARLTSEVTKKYNEFMEKIPESKRRGVHTKLLNLGIEVAIDILNEQMESK